MGFYEVPKAKIFPRNEATHNFFLEKSIWTERGVTERSR